MIIHRDIIRNGYLITLQIRLNILPPVTKKDSLILKAGSYMLQNMGATAAILDSGWTLLPGMNLSLGAEDDINVMNHELEVRFDANIADIASSAYPGNRLEVMELITTVCSCEPCKIPLQ